MKPHPEVIELDYQDLQAKLNQIETALGASVAQPFRQLLDWYATLEQLLRDKTISLQRIQQAGGVPLPASIQWELVRDAVDQGLQTAYDQLLGLAAQGELVHNDDTRARVLTLMAKTKNQQPLLDEDPERTGVFTTGILSLADGRPTIALFFTGPHHAGENLRDLLAKRPRELPPPIQMCDALSRNMPDDLRVILANCLTHGRRNFVDVVAAFPSEVEYVLQCLKKVSTTDAHAKQQALPPDERLRLHQEQSGPVMDELHRWLQRQFDERKVEPNSSLGGAISSMLRHWEKLTLFLRVAGAPLVNNVRTSPENGTTDSSWPPPNRARSPAAGHPVTPGRTPRPLRTVDEPLTRR